jgi:hypothetical protein
MRIYHPGTRIQGQKVSGSRIRIKENFITVFLTLKSVSQLLEKLSKMFIPDPDLSPSRIQDSKKHRITDPEHWLGNNIGREHAFTLTIRNKASNGTHDIVKLLKS